VVAFIGVNLGIQSRHDLPLDTTGLVRSLAQNEFRLNNGVVVTSDPLGSLDKAVLPESLSIDG
jgi:hypothetical protein